MNHPFLLSFKLWNPVFFAFLLPFSASFNCVAQTPGHPDPDICKQLAIESAQLANQSFEYVQKSYFALHSFSSVNNIDTAIMLIEESILQIDSAIDLASDSSILGIEYATIAKNYAVDSYNTLVVFKNSQNNFQKNELSKNAMSDSQNATVEAYKASFYLKAGKKPRPQKQITKLDIDQTLFTLLKEELQQKKEINAQEISNLSDVLSKTNDPEKQSRLKDQLSALESRGKEWDRKAIDAQQKLSSINSLIEERDKAQAKYLENEETVFSKMIVKTTDQWNKPFKLDEELPDGLIYQVQLGVYKNPLIPGIFKGITPIYGKTTEKGISYSTGLFEKLADAREAKKYILGMGFTDAFIIAYNNKKKITLEEAIKLEK